MYLGRDDYELTAVLLEGVALGHSKWHAGFMYSVLHEGFRHFLSKKYGKEEADRVVWHQILTLSNDWDELTEKEKIARLLQDFQDYDNLLIRLAVEA